jgi:NMD protein affecting ribosome stability and mRNA decay
MKNPQKHSHGFLKSPGRRLILKGERREREEFPSKTEIVFCEKGDAVYYHKAWRHHFEDYRHLKENKSVKFALCPYHKMEKEGVYEGEIRIAKIPAEKFGEVAAAANAFGRRAYRRDPMHRIMKIKTENGWLKIYTSENQLAERLAKKLFEIFKKRFTKPKIHKGKREDPFIVTMEWSVK